MYKKRIGNDIRVLALIRQRIEGVLSPFDMRGRDISVGLVNPRGVEMSVPDFEIAGDDGSILAFNFYGKDQRLVGVYTVVVRENDREIEMRSVDKTASFELVGHSHQEETANEGVISIESLKIEMELAIGTKGDKGDKGDKMTYADLTEADKADLYEGGASLIRPLLDGKQDTISDLETIRSNAQNASDVVSSIVNAGYVFAGVATPITDPGTPNAKVFYIANGKGTYTKFGGLEVTEEDVVVLYYDTAWHKVATGIASNEKLTELSVRVDNVDNTLFYEKDKVVQFVNGLVYAQGLTLFTSSADKVSKPIPLRKGETIKVSTKGDEKWLFSVLVKVSEYFVPAEGARAEQVLAKLSKNSLTEYSYTATEDMFVSCCVLNDATSSINFEDLLPGSKVEDIEKKIEKLSSVKTGVLGDKNVMFFGDSLTSHNTVIGFAKLIAEYYDMPYRRFAYDSDDGNANDVVVDFKSFTNYAKDGTLNHTTTDRHDSVVERVKRHISANTNIDYVLVECCVNDAAPANLNKGEIAPTYTEAFDQSTTIGAIEEVIRYITTLGKPIRLGFFIPWKITWADPTFFDAHIEVFEKWGIPYLDLRRSAGFNIKNCAAHRNLYSLSTDTYDAFDITKTYNLDDKVKYNGSSYKCTANGVVGILPTDSSKWILVSSGTSDGTHLNDLGHKIVTGKIQNFIESL